MTMAKPKHDPIAFSSQKNLAKAVNRFVVSQGCGVKFRYGNELKSCGSRTNSGAGILCERCFNSFTKLSGF